MRQHNWVSEMHSHDQSNRTFRDVLREMAITLSMSYRLIVFSRAPIETEIIL